MSALLEGLTRLKKGEQLWIQILANLENTQGESINNLQQTAGVTIDTSAHTVQRDVKEYIKVKNGDEFGNIKISQVSENKVVVKCLSLE